MKHVLLVVACLALCHCQNGQFRAREVGALGGAALGAGLGAIIGHKTGASGAGIAIGSAVGALSGGLVGNEMDRQEDELMAQDDRINEQDRMLRENRELIDELRRRGADARATSRGVVVNLPDVLFDFDRATLRRDSSRTVSEIAAVIDSTKGRHVSIEGHTDSVGTVVYNQRLSEARAHAVEAELIAEGVARARLSTQGFGESDPIASNNSEEGRSRNRRVEVIIENRR